MNPYVIAGMLVAATSGAAATGAEAMPAACTAEHFAEARSLSQLPTAVAQTLGRDVPGLEGIADRGGRFNPTDVPSPGLPMKRFTLAALGKDCVLVVIERGGIAHYFSLLAFERTGPVWRMTELGLLPGPPVTLQELLAGARK